MTTIAELERCINDILSSNYANDEMETGGDKKALNELIDKGIEVGSPYAIKLRAVDHAYAKRWTEEEKIPKEHLNMLEESAQYGFKTCMTILAEKDDLYISRTKRYAYLKLSRTLPGCGQYDLKDFNLTEEEEREALALYEKMNKGIKKFYEGFENELLIGAEGYNGEWDTI